MSTATTSGDIITRTERGLTIAGTRITLYSVMDYLKAGWPPTLIRHWLNLSESQIEGSLAYIEAHRDEFEAEYQEVLKKADATRAYWEERNRQRFEDIAKDHQKPEKADLYKKLQEREGPARFIMITVLIDHDIEGQAALHKMPIHSPRFLSSLSLT